MITRRNFLKNTALGIAGAAIPLAALEIVDPKKLFAQEAAETTSGAMGVPGRHVQVRRLRVLRQGLQAGKRSPLRRQRHQDLGGALRSHQGREDVTPTHPRAHGTASLTAKIDHERGRDQGHHATRTSKRRSSFRSSATSAKIRPACRSARWGPPTRRRTASCWWTGPGASAAGTASWAVPTACGSSTRSITRRRNAISAITGSPRA